jgi:hypothetical protein
VGGFNGRFVRISCRESNKSHILRSSSLCNFLQCYFVSHVFSQTTLNSHIKIKTGIVCWCSFMRAYPKVSGLDAWSDNCKWYSSLPLSVVVSLFCESV